MMKKLPNSVLVLITLGLICAAGAQALDPKAPDAATPAAVADAAKHVVTPFMPFAPLTDSTKYNTWEKIALCINVVVALAGLGYAWMLVGQVTRAPQGTPKMQEIARAVREGADA